MIVTRRTPTRLLLLTTALALSTAYPAAQLANSKPAAGSAKKYRLAGTVASKIDGHPLSRARVTVRDAKNPDKFQSMITSEDGKFEFNDLATGKYSLRGAKRGFISASYDQHDPYSTAIVTGAGLDTENLVLKLAPDAVITGRVLDEAGEPVRHATVTLYLDDHRQGVDQIHPVRSAQTDDLGTYEITPLMPGTYFLSASATPWYAIHPQSEADHSEPSERTPAVAVERSLDVAYLTTYYADVTDTESATPIPVRGGERLQVDIHLNPVPALRLLFRVPGDVKTGPTFHLEQPAFDGTTVPSVGIRPVSPGLWELTGIPAGRYNIRMQGAQTGVQLDGVELNKDGEEVDTSTGEPLSDVKVSVHAADQAALPQQLAVGLRSNGRTMARWQRLDTKGETEIDQVPAGRYDVVLLGPSVPYSITHISAEGANVTGHTVTVGAGASPVLSLTLAEGRVEVQGTVKRAGKGFAGAMVVLVPKNPEGNRDLFRRDQSDLDGTFALHNVVPGFYTLVAIDNGWDLDWSQPSVIAVYLKRGRKIEVGNRSQPLNTADVEVQTK